MTHNLTVHTSRDVPLHLVYRRQSDRCDPETVIEEDVKFHLLTRPSQAIGHMFPLVRAWGWRGWLKTAAKLATPSRSLYVTFVDGECASFGWVMRGHCRAYKIEPSACVIGPIFTADRMRGRGLAPLGMRFAVNELSKNGWNTHYIDASSDNFASQRAILKAGFVGPVAAVPSHSNAHK